MRTEPQEREDFEAAVREEIQISSEFGLPLCAVVVRLPEGLGPELSRRLLEGLRLADLVTVSGPEELSLVLPNTSREAARVVEERLLSTAPGAALGAADYEPSDTPESLVERARRSLAGASF